MHDEQKKSQSALSLFFSFSVLRRFTSSFAISTSFTALASSVFGLLSQVFLVDNSIHSTVTCANYYGLFSLDEIEAESQARTVQYCSCAVVEHVRNGRIR